MAYPLLRRKWTSEINRDTEIASSPRCPLCGEESEDGPHFVFRCPHQSEERERLMVALDQRGRLPRSPLIKDNSRGIHTYACSMGSLVRARLWARPLTAGILTFMSVSAGLCILCKRSGGKN